MTSSDLSLLSRVRGCLLGGAVGDALGAPVEFMALDEIRRTFGSQGIVEFAPAYGLIGAVTDDTQMTLFATEGIIRAHVRGRERGICHAPSVIHHALLRWLHTQGANNPALNRIEPGGPDGWLSQRHEFYTVRAPGRTCLAALQASSHLGEAARNDRKGCGALVRIAPIGLFSGFEPEAEPSTYSVACESARTTHGHPSSTFASGFFALTIACVGRGVPLVEAIACAKAPFLGEIGARQVLSAIDRAVSLAESTTPATPEVIERFGAGWVAEEALAIALFSALRAETFAHGVRLAVNHSGDSDSTGSLTGQLLGTAWGAECIPSDWVERVELRDVIEILAADLTRVVSDELPDDGSRYPGW